MICSVRRKLYDKFGVEGLKCGGGPTRAGFKGVERTLYKRANKTEDLKYPLKVQLHEMYCGSVRRLQLNKDKICPSCKGYYRYFQLNLTLHCALMLYLIGMEDIQRA